MVKCWILADEITDQRDECHCNPPEYVPVEGLASLGVLYFYVPVDNRDKGLAEISKKRGYNYNDEIIVKRTTLPNYDEKIKSFFEEHLHTDEEIRYIADGAGYFDVRGLKEEWIRIHCEPGDLIILPEGIYHRFTVTKDDYVHAIRLFKGEPVWTPYNRDKNTDKMSERISYKSKLCA